MAHDEFKMGTGQAHEFAQACARNGLSLEDVKYLSGGKRLARALAFLRGETLPNETLTVNPAAALVTSPAENGLEPIWVDSDLACFVNLAPCEDDDRPLQSLFVLPSAMNDSAIAQSVGGLATLTARKSSVGQLMREVTLARSGQKGLFKKGQYYLLYLEGADGSLVTVLVCWDTDDSGWRVYCYRFDQGGEWHQGDQVYGN